MTDWELLGVLAILLGGYPLIVLLVAITGPHSEFERRANESSFDEARDNG